MASAGAKRVDVRCRHRPPDFAEWKVLTTDSGNKKIERQKLLKRIVNCIIWCFTEQRCGRYIDGGVKVCSPQLCCGSVLESDA